MINIDLFYLLLVLLLLASFFASTETAITSLSKTTIRSIKKGKKNWQVKLSLILEDQQKLLISLLIGNNFVHIWATSLATAFTLKNFGIENLPTATVLITVVLLFFGEILPKNLAANNNIFFSKIFSIPTFYYIKIIKPFSFIFLQINNFFIKPRKNKPKPKFFLGDEFKTLATISKNDGVLNTTEHSMLNKALDFKQIKLRKIMIPRTQIRYIKNTSTIDELYNEFKKTRFSRLPVFSISEDSFIGFIHYKDFLFFTKDNSFDGNKIIPNSLIRKLIYLPETQSLQNFLKQMKFHTNNLAIVIDERGLATGLVTVDDVLSSVVGNIKDEFASSSSNPEDFIKVISENQVVIPGLLKLSEFNALFNSELKSNWYDTVGGYIIEQLSYLPNEQEKLESDSFIFVINEISNRSIKKITLQVK